MDAATAKASAGIAYATASHATIFTSVALAFVGLGLALVLLLRPRTSALCIWSLGLFSLAWLLESTTHLMGLGGNVSIGTLKCGVWTAVGLFGIGLLTGILGVLAYLRNEHKYDRGLTVGVLATLLNLWVVGGIVTALRNQQLGGLGRGLVMPVMPSGGPVDEQALLAHLANQPQHEPSELAQKMRGILGMAFADLTSALSGDKAGAWELQTSDGTSDPAAILKGHPCGSPEVLRELHPSAQYVFKHASETGWLSLELSREAQGPDAAGTIDAKAEEKFAALLLPLTPPRRERAGRGHLAGFEIVRVTTRASVNGLAGELYFDRWTAASGSTVIHVLACAPQNTQTFQVSTETMVSALLRRLQREGLSEPALDEARQRPYAEAVRLEKEERRPEALAVWQKQAAATPGEPESFLGVLRCLWKLGQPKQALAWLEAGATPRAESVSATVADLRIRAANGQKEAQEKLRQRFKAGLADDEALAAMLVGMVAARDRAGALEILAAHGPRHGSTIVAWWQGYLSTPPSAAPTPTPAPAAASAVTASKLVPTDSRAAAEPNAQQRGRTRSTRATTRR